MSEILPFRECRLSLGDSDNYHMFKPLIEKYLNSYFEEYLCAYENVAGKNYHLHIMAQLKVG